MEYKRKQIDKIPILYNYYQLPEIKDIEIDLSKEKEDEKKKVLKSRKDDKKQKGEIKEENKEK